MQKECNKFHKEYEDTCIGIETQFLADINKLESKIIKEKEHHSNIITQNQVYLLFTLSIA